MQLDQLPRVKQHPGLRKPPSGVGAARVTLASTYVARTVVPAERTAWLGFVAGMQLLEFVEPEAVFEGGQERTHSEPNEQQSDKSEQK